MSRKRRRGLPSVTSAFARQLQELLRKSTANPTDKVEIDVPYSPTIRRVDPTNRPESSEVAHEKRVRRWFVEFNQVADMFPDLYFATAKPKPGDINITGVYEDGMVVASYKAKDAQYNVFAKFSHNTSPAGCSCSVSNGEKPCEHAYHFVKYLVQLLNSPAPTSLAQRIHNREFDTNKPAKSLFEFDPSSLVLRNLDVLVGQFTNALTEQDESGLGPIVELEPTRIAWNVSLKPGGIHFEPYEQPAKKRGGWSKGKKIPLSSLSKCQNATFSPADRRVEQLIEVNTDRYARLSAPCLIHPFQALAELVGEPNVMLNGQPATVTWGEGIFALYTANGKVKFRSTEAPANETCTYAFDSNYMFIASEARNAISLYRGQTEQINCLRRLFSFEPVPETHLPELIDRAKKLQKVVNLQLPADTLGPLTPEKTQPVVILRSRSDGALDYGLRVRDSANRLRKPGEGNLIYAGERDGKPVQLMRSATNELNSTRSIAHRCGFNPSRVDGTIGNFDDALRTIERLQSIEPEVEVLWDKSSEASLRILGTVTASNVKVGITQKRDWFNLSGECQVGDQTFELSTFLNDLQAAKGDAINGEFVRLGNAGWARISEQLRTSLKRLHDAVNQERGTLKFDRTSTLALRDLSGEVQIDGAKAWQESLKRLEKAEKLEPVLPTGFQATLRDYQFEGYCWLRRLAEWGVGGILADDMGLGKTVQTLAVMLDRKSDGPQLVIAPTSVGFNWLRESQKFAPELQAHLYRETDRAEFLETLGPGDLVICSYGLALRDAPALAKVQWGTVVLDEAQAIKNSRSKTSTAIATIPSLWTVALTGTPVENHLGELWSLFHVVSPGVFGGWDQFRNRFAGPIEKANDDDRRQALRSRLQPFVLRRTKGQVLKDLPARTEMNLYVELSPAERQMYDQVRLSAIGEIDAIAKLPEIQDQRFRILALLTRLRQLACHPRLVHENWSERSAKLIQLHETLLQLREEGHRVLIFSQFVQHLGVIREMLEAEQISYQYLDGSTPPVARQEQVDLFQNGDATAFLISLKAGGTGLNLTAADYVIHMDPWWNPAVEDQATDRAHRIGQEKPVMVYRIVAQNTIEEEILKLHDTKRDLVAGVLDGTHSAAKLSTEDLINLLRS